MLPIKHLIRISAGPSLGLLIVLGSATSVCANAGPSETSVNVVAEPVGIEHVQIVRETLQLDLRPLETGDPAIVEAAYDLHNDGDETTLDLLFAFGTRENSWFQVRLNGKDVAGAVQESRMPSDWTPPRSTPGLDGAADVIYAGGWSTVQPSAFTIVAPPGPSTLMVRYRAAPKYTYARPAMIRQFAYVLAPARSWAGFGGLDVVVQIPQGWSVASRPALRHDAATLTGSFDDVPADTIELTLRPPIPPGYQIAMQSARWLYAVVGIGGLICCWRWGGGRGRSILLGFTYGAIVLASGLATVSVDALFPPTTSELELTRQLRLTAGYGEFVATAGIVLLSLLATIVGGLVALFRRRPSPDPDPDR